MFSKNLADRQRNIGRINNYSVARSLLLIGVVVGLAACDPVNGQASGTTVPPTDAPVSDFGNWTVSRVTDPMTDEKIIAIQLASDQAQSTRGVMFSIYCSKQNAWAVISWNEFLGGTRSGGLELKPVTYRIGDSGPSTENWPVLSDRITSQISDAPKFVTRVRESEKLVLRVEPYQQNPLTAVFQISGLKAALMASSPECDWYVRDIKWAEYQAKLKAEAEKKAGTAQQASDGTK